MSITRRRFLRTAIAAVSGYALGDLLPARAEEARATDGVSATFDAVSAGQPLGLVPFSEEGAEALEIMAGEGLDGRLFTDLTWLGPGTLETPLQRFFVRTAAPARLPPVDGWALRLGGRVEKESRMSLAELKGLGVGPAALHAVECSGNGRVMHFGMLSSARFAGVPVAQVLKRTRPAGGATRVLISGFDEHNATSANSVAGASWVFTPAQLESALLVTAMNGVPLPLDHGAPVRLLVPGWYGCTCIKWVDELRWVGEDEPATSQMREFAARTHQDGEPVLARDYKPAAMDQAAVPVRMEKWKVGGKLVYRIVGVTWGGAKPSSRLALRCVPKLPSDERFSVVSECGPRGPGRPWALWSALWQPATAGTYAIQLLVNEPDAVQKRLKTGFYTRTVKITEV